MTVAFKRTTIFSLAIVGLVLSLTLRDPAHYSRLAVTANFVPPVCLYLLSDKALTRINSRLIKNLMFVVAIALLIIITISHLQ